jgi:hypothetical protein
MVPESDGTTIFRRICRPGLRQQFPICANLKPRRQALMKSRPPHGQEGRVPMIRRIATLTAGAVLWAALALLEPAAQAAPQSAQQSTPPPVQQPAPDAVSPLPPTPAPMPNRKPHSGSAHSATVDNVIRGSDTLSLVALLPWWRADESRPPDAGELESPVLTACDVWLGFPFATADAQSLTVRLSLAQRADVLDQVANRTRVIDAGEVNEIDLTAPDEPQRAGPSWLLRGLLAILGSALAAFAAVRYLAA